MIYLLNFFLLSCGVFSSLIALDKTDELAIQNVIHAYTNAWNQHEGRGFGNDFTEDADFINIIGMHFAGKEEIELRHQQILKTFLKDSTFEVLNIQLREASAGLVIALVNWKLNGFRHPQSNMSPKGEIQEGVFMHVFLKKMING